MGYPVYSITHYYTLNGDAMRDPDMRILVDRTHGHIIPLYFRQDGVPYTQYGILEQKVFVSDDAREYYPSIASDLDHFLSVWSKNILSQGFKPEQASVLSLD